MNPRLCSAAVWSIAVLVTGAVDSLVAQVAAVQPTTPGSHWVIVASPNGSAGPSILEDVAVRAADDVWAVGAQGNLLAPTGFTLIEHWDGRTWSVVPSPSPKRFTTDADLLFGVTAVAEDDAWAVGEHLINYSLAKALIEHWDGSAWTVVDGAETGSIDASLSDVFAVASDDVWAVGKYGLDTLIEHWDGTRWTIQPSPSPGTYRNSLQSISGTGRDDMWAVGGQEDRNSRNAPLVVHYDGHAWTDVPTPTGVYSLSAISAIAPDDAWAVGGTIVEHWDGVVWSIVPTARSGAKFDVFNAVAAADSDDVWIVGGSQGPSGRSVNLTEHWDGVAWSIVPSPGLENDTFSTAVAAPMRGPAWMVGNVGPYTGGRTLTMHSDRD